MRKTGFTHFGRTLISNFFWNGGKARSLYRTVRSLNLQADRYSSKRQRPRHNFNAVRSLLHQGQTAAVMNQGEFKSCKSLTSLSKARLLYCAFTDPNYNSGSIFCGHGAVLLSTGHGPSLFDSNFGRQTFIFRTSFSYTFAFLDLDPCAHILACTRTCDLLSMWTAHHFAKSFPLEGMHKRPMAWELVFQSRFEHSLQAQNAAVLYADARKAWNDSMEIRKKRAVCTALVQKKLHFLLLSLVETEMVHCNMSLFRINSAWPNSSLRKAEHFSAYSIARAYLSQIFGSSSTTKLCTAEEGFTELAAHSIAPPSSSEFYSGDFSIPALFYLASTISAQNILSNFDTSICSGVQVFLLWKT